MNHLPSQVRPFLGPNPAVKAKARNWLALFSAKLKLWAKCDLSSGIGRSG